MNALILTWELECPRHPTQHEAQLEIDVCLIIFINMKMYTDHNLKELVI